MKIQRSRLRLIVLVAAMAASVSACGGTWAISVEQHRKIAICSGRDAAQIPECKRRGASQKSEYTSEEGQASEVKKQ